MREIVACRPLGGQILTNPELSCPALRRNKPHRETAALG